MSILYPHPPRVSPSKRAYLTPHTVGCKDLHFCIPTKIQKCKCCMSILDHHPPRVTPSEIAYLTQLAVKICIFAFLQKYKNAKFFVTNCQAKVKSSQEKVQSQRKSQERERKT